MWHVVARALKLSVFSESFSVSFFSHSLFPKLFEQPRPSSSHFPPVWSFSSSLWTRPHKPPRTALFGWFWRCSNLQTLSRSNSKDLWLQPASSWSSSQNCRQKEETGVSSDLTRGADAAAKRLAPNLGDPTQINPRERKTVEKRFVSDDLQTVRAETRQV